MTTEWIVKRHPTGVDWGVYRAGHSWAGPVFRGTETECRAWADRH